MLLVPVSSTDIYAAGYDPNTFELQIQFATGAIYSYMNVPSEVYDGFVYAPSKGSYVAQVLRKNPNLYPYTRIL